MVGERLYHYGTSARRYHSPVLDVSSSHPVLSTRFVGNVPRHYRYQSPENANWHLPGPLASVAPKSCAPPKKVGNIRPRPQIDNSEDVMEKHMYYWATERKNQSQGSLVNSAQSLDSFAAAEGRKQCTPQRTQQNLLELKHRRQQQLEVWRSRRSFGRCTKPPAEMAPYANSSGDCYRPPGRPAGPRKLPEPSRRLEVSRSGIRRRTSTPDTRTSWQALPIDTSLIRSLHRTCSTLDQPRRAISHHSVPGSRAAAAKKPERPPPRPDRPKAPRCCSISRETCSLPYIRSPLSPQPKKPQPRKKPPRSAAPNKPNRTRPSRGDSDFRLETKLPHKYAPPVRLKQGALLGSAFGHAHAHARVPQRRRGAVASAANLRPANSERLQSRKEAKARRGLSKIMTGGKVSVSSIRRISDPTARRIRIIRYQRIAIRDVGTQTSSSDLQETVPATNVAKILMARHITRNRGHGRTSRADSFTSTAFGGNSFR